MEKYVSQSGKPYGVSEYDFGVGFIVVRFKNGGKYTYSTRNNSTEVIDAMIELALQNEGLSTFISQHKPKPD